MASTDKDFWLLVAVVLGVAGYIYLEDEPYASGNSFASNNTGFAINNPGNLRYLSSNAFVGQTGKSASGFGIYDTLAHGVRAMYKQLTAYQNRGLSTVREMIRTYAPASENDTQAYIADVSDQMGVSPDEALTWPGDAVPMIQAMALHENGYNDMSNVQVERYIRGA